MRFTTQALIVAAALAALGIYGAVRQPYGTLLPMDVGDLSEVQPQLDRLDEDERALVLGYLKRSNGDVLPPAMADPDYPFTARTFGEAIELQKRYLREQAERDAAVAQRQAERDRLLEPLREALALGLLRRELLTSDEALGIADTGGAKRADDGTRVLVVTYRLSNRSGRDIVSAKGSVDVRDADGRRRAHCWLEQDALEAFASADLRCGNAMRTADPDERAFAELAADSLRLDWEPAEIVFADGSRLTAPR
ncbi:hypothetical protein [Tahibacter caeni]|uniref:hypothetical protein n=1 Tax=Tahibacter caeni TaxID=1453545 RepID=UPI002147E7F6|nr:hypothetical protein [Tahibacter caeni]